MAAGCGSTHLRLPDLVVPAIDLQLLQQGSDGLPAGLHILGQQDLELLREVLACVGKDSVSTLEAAVTSRQGQVPPLCFGAKAPGTM